jgi:hypothetical protein
MSRLLVSFLVLSVLAGSPAMAADRHAGTLDDGGAVTVLAATPDRVVLRFDTGSFRLGDVDVQGDPWSRISWNGGVDRLERGSPALPAFRESIVIPDDAKVELTVLSSTYRDYPNVRIAPSKGPITRDVLPEDVDWTFGDVYQRNDWFPADVGELGDPYIMRDVRGVVVMVQPFQWNPVTETLRVWTLVEVEVKATGAGEVNVLTRRPAERTAEFEKIYARHFLNYGSPLRYAPVGEVGRMLVIAYDAFAAAAQPLVDWKNQMGMETRLVLRSEVGTTPAEFKSYIQDAYDNEGVCFIILVGDAAQIPYYTNDGGAADPMMTLLAGADSYPDAFIGRISATSVSQVETQVERIIEYERDPDPAGDWYAKGIAIASNEGEGYGDDGEADWEHARNYRADLLGFTYTHVDELYDGTHPDDGPGHGGDGTDQPGDPTENHVASRVNAGRSLLHYTGHGSTWDWVTTGFSVADINALTNDNRLPFVVSVGCVNGAFMSGTCFAEAWMRATNGAEPTGAVACYASTVNQQWATPMRAQDEMIDLMCTDSKRTYGGLCFNGSCDMIDHYGANGISEFKNWTVFGDPSLPVRTAVPVSIEVIVATSVDPDAGLFEVATEPFSLAALSDGGTYIGSVFAGASGLASIPYDGADLFGLTEVTLTVTGFNRIPNIGTVPVGSDATSASILARGAHLQQNRPNPFERSTSISFTLGREEAVVLEIFDVAGRRVRTLAGGTLPAGGHAVTWDGVDDQGRALPAGSYFYRLTAGEIVETRRMVSLR